MNKITSVQYICADRTKPLVIIERLSGKPKSYQPNQKSASCLCSAINRIARSGNIRIVTYPDGWAALLYERDHEVQEELPMGAKLAAKALQVSDAIHKKDLEVADLVRRREIAKDNAEIAFANGMDEDYISAMKRLRDLEYLTDIAEAGARALQREYEIYAALLTSK